MGDRFLANRDRWRRCIIPRGHPLSGNFGLTNIRVQLVKQGSGILEIMRKLYGANKAARPAKTARSLCAQSKQSSYYQGIPKGLRPQFPEDRGRPPLEDSLSAPASRLNSLLYPI